MNWDAVFSGANLLALLAWAALILLPRRPALMALLSGAGVGSLCLVYVAGLLSITSGLIDPIATEGGGRGGADFTTIAGVRSIFMSDGGAVVGWVHYLAFDLFAGLWIARDADRRGFYRLAQAPILLATFLAGPLGLGIWLLLRRFIVRKS